MSGWILCSEDMPKEFVLPLMKKAGYNLSFSEKVLITIVDEKVLSGEKEPYEGDRVVICESFHNGELPTGCLVRNFGRPYAWRSLPEPYYGKGVADQNE